MNLLIAKSISYVLKQFRHETQHFPIDNALVHLAHLCQKTKLKIYKVIEYISAIIFDLNGYTTIQIWILNIPTF